MSKSALILSLFHRQKTFQVQDAQEVKVSNRRSSKQNLASMNNVIYTILCQGDT